MSADAFFDTNVLVYSVERETDRAVIARAAMKGGGVISVQVLNECASVLRRKVSWDWPKISVALG